MQLTIKEINDNGLVLEGYGVIFNVEDLHGDVFTKETNFYLENFDKLPVLYGHNLKEIKGKIGEAIVKEVNDFGVLFNIIINRSNQYKELIKKLVELGKLGLSSGTAEQFFAKEGNLIKEWGLVEISLTETPAELRTILTLEEVELLKELGDAEISDESVDALEEIELPVDKENKIKIEILGENKMEDVKVESDNSRFDELMKGFEEKIAKLTALIEDTPAAKAGYVTSDGGTADKHIKSFGDFLVAVRRGDVERITKVYQTTKDLSESPGSAGGYLVPTEYGSTLIQAAAFDNPVYSRVQKIPVMRESGT